MKPLAEILLIPAPDQDTLYLQSELQKYMTTLTEGSSCDAILIMGRAWLESGRGRKMRFESEVFGNQEATSVEELKEIVGTLYDAMTPARTGK
jgi:hypothetical protein